MDFAYTVHTNVGHRCRGARVDGVMVPLNTPLQNGQTVEVTTVKEGGPSRDWLNAELGYLTSHRARAKVRPGSMRWHSMKRWRVGAKPLKSCCSAKARRPCGWKIWPVNWASSRPMPLFEVVGKDEFSLRNIETVLRPPEPVLQPDDYLLLKKPRSNDKSPREACWWWAWNRC